MLICGRCVTVSAHTELEEKAAACDTSISSLLLGTPHFDSVYKEQEIEVRARVVTLRAALRVTPASFLSL